PPTGGHAMKDAYARFVLWLIGPALERSALPARVATLETGATDNRMALDSLGARLGEVESAAFDAASGLVAVQASVAEARGIAESIERREKERNDALIRGVQDAPLPFISTGALGPRSQATLEDASARQHQAISNLEAEAAVDAGVPGSSSEQRSMAESLSTSLDQVASRVSREHAERVRAFLRTNSQ